MFCSYPHSLGSAAFVMEPSFHLFCNLCKIEVVPAKGDNLVYGGLLEFDSGEEKVSLFAVDKVVERLLGMSANVYHDLADSERDEVLAALYGAVRVRYEAQVQSAADGRRIPLPRTDDASASGVTDGMFFSLRLPLFSPSSLLCLHASHAHHHHLSGACIYLKWSA